MDSKQLTKQQLEDESLYIEYVEELDQPEDFDQDDLIDEDIQHEVINEDDNPTVQDDRGSHLQISEESNQDYEVLDYNTYDSNAALEYEARDEQISDCENSETSDKEHSYDSESTILDEREHSSFEEFTSHDELDDSALNYNPIYKVVTEGSIDSGSMETGLNQDTQLPKDSNCSNKVVADIMDKVQSTSGNLEFKIWENIRGKSESDEENAQVKTSASKCIQFTNTTNVNQYPDLKPEAISYENNMICNDIPITTQSTSDYDASLTTDSFESHLKRAKERQKVIESKMQKLLKNLTVLNVHNMAKHMSKEIASLHEYMCDLHNSKHSEEVVDVCSPDFIQPAEQYFSDYNSMLSEIQNFNTNQETALSRQKHHNKYFGAGASAYQMNPKCTPQSLLPPLSSKDAKSIRDASKQFNTQLRLLEETMDSDATESSSSDESGFDEGYNNEHQRQMPLSKRTSTQLIKLESMYGSRMRWIQLHVAFLEIRKKYHDYIHAALQSSKSRLKFIDNDTKEAVPIRDPTNTSDFDNDKFSCARIRPLDIISFRKRKLLQTENLHTVSKYAAQTSTLRCGCKWPYHPCALCTGRVDPTAPRLPNDCLDLPNKLALLDPGIHPNLSVLSEVHQNLHFNAIMKMQEWQAKMIRCGPRIKTLLAATSAADRRMLKEELKHDRPRKFIKKPVASSTTIVKPMKHGFKKRGRKPSHSKSGKRRKVADFDDHYDSSLSTNMSEESQNVTTWSKDVARQERPAQQRSTSFDIDNMVIPYGVPVTTKVQVLPYKEIITPKWRVVNYDPLLEFESIEPETVNIEEARIRTSSYSMESDEDVSDETVLKRHMRCLLEERKKFGVYTKLSWTTRSRANRRLESKTMDMMPVTPQSEHTSENELSHGLNEVIESIDNTDVNMEPTPDYTNVERLHKRKSIQSTSQVIIKEQGSDADTVSDVAILPFSSRQFPLTDEDYDSMVSVMPAKHTEILNMMQSNGSDELLRQSFTETDPIDMNVTSPFNEVIIKKESNIDSGVIGQFTMSDSDESPTIDDPDDPEWG